MGASASRISTENDTEEVVNRRRRYFRCLWEMMDHSKEGALARSAEEGGMSVILTFSGTPRNWLVLDREHSWGVLQQGAVEALGDYFAEGLFVLMTKRGIPIRLVEVINERNATFWDPFVSPLNFVKMVRRLRRRCEELLGKEPGAGCPVRLLVGGTSLLL
uniref:Uncharacterized protein n=1 Tax=Chromera velia CCMP2878 TaxID=1169474 RepID=A0A0G4GM28_9ALVE|eukprot:Cvel_4898.t1-p1 / transcript=Cvel_4898.t1 / gene=Cvel_4898 / organism=Chromera_velia_CCMP2878 / gene_product=hypothetical protein / transcript_product=hypothetical protein / location=Cvel_scaffold221:6162-6641(-) / protein_length=160 / sequence_SO=supercontig / SO=protein_coding / is_pseudo=false